MPTEEKPNRRKSWPVNWVQLRHELAEELVARFSAMIHKYRHARITVVAENIRLKERVEKLRIKAEALDAAHQERVRAERASRREEEEGVEALDQIVGRMGGGRNAWKD